MLREGGIEPPNIDGAIKQDLQSQLYRLLILSYCPLHSSKISLAQMQVGRAARTLTFLGYGIIAVAISAGAFEEVFMLLLQEQHSGAGSEN